MYQLTEKGRKAWKTDPNLTPRQKTILEWLHTLMGRKLFHRALEADILSPLAKSILISLKMKGLVEEV